MELGDGKLEKLTAIENEIVAERKLFSIIHDRVHLRPYQMDYHDSHENFMQPDN